VFAKQHKLPICFGSAGRDVLLLLLVAGCAPDEDGQGDLTAEYRRLAESDAAALAFGEYSEHSSFCNSFSISRDDFALGQDAVRLLTDAQGEASNSGRNVMLQFSGPRCPPCKAMSIALASVSRQLEKDFVYVQVDRRMHNFDEVYSAYSRDVGSVPYICVLSPSGQVMASGTIEGKNMGYPSTPGAIAHFRSMLEATSKRSSKQELNQIVDAFNFAGSAANDG